MPGPYPLDTLAAQVDEFGISAPPYEDVLASLVANFKSIYGADIYVEPDSQDGQMIAIFAKAVKDANDLAIATYNAFSPSTAQGNGLSSMVKINGMKRMVATYSTVDVTLVGQVGTIIDQGRVSDTNRNVWKLPDQVIIPIEGQIDVTATCITIGAIEAVAGSVTTIVNPQFGWQTVTNPEAATPGAPVETDAALRARQSVSASLPSESPVDGLYGDIANLIGVKELVIYENWTNITDANGVPSHSFAAVIDGGDDDEIANAIALRKTVGTGMLGDTQVMIIDPKGMPIIIKFFRPTTVRLTAQVSIKLLERYVSTTGDAIKQAMADYVSAIPIGQPVYRNRLWTPANLSGGALSLTYDVLDIRIGRYPQTPGSSDLTLAFTEVADLDVSDITLTTS